MKKWPLLLLAIFIYSSGIACTFRPETFCRTLDYRGDDLVLTGEIVAIDTTGIDVKIIDVLRGVETRDTIRIWDGTDFDCNGIVSMAAAHLGELNDTFVLVLPMILEKENDWEVIGDYRRPDMHTLTTDLKVENGVVSGLIKGDVIAPPQFNILRLHYDHFKAKIIENGGCASIILNTADASGTTKIKVNNPFSTNLSIQLDEIIDRGSLRLISMQGGILLTEEINSQDRIDLVADDLPAGLYVLEIRTRGELPTLQKVVKL